MPDDLIIELTPSEGLSASRFDRECAELAEDLRRVRGVLVNQPETAPTPGMKSGMLQQIGTLVVSGLLSAAALKAVSDILVAPLHRSTAGTVTVRRGGAEVSLSGLHSKDVAAEAAKLVEALEEGE